MDFFSTAVRLIMARTEVLRKAYIPLCFDGISVISVSDFCILYRQLDLFADFIMFLCDNEGRTLTMDRYPDYISRIRDINDIEERILLLEEKLKSIEV